MKLTEDDTGMPSNHAVSLRVGKSRNVSDGALGDQLGINMTDAQIKQCTAKVKAMADVRKLSIEDPDIIINQFYQNLKSDQEKPLLDDLTQEEKEAFAKKENELNGEPEMQKLDKLANAHTNGVVTDHVQA